jgi:C4-type Zn-finger protein
MTVFTVKCTNCNYRAEFVARRPEDRQYQLNVANAARDLHERLGHKSTVTETWKGPRVKAA